MPDLPRPRRALETAGGAEHRRAGRALSGQGARRLQKRRAAERDDDGGGADPFGRRHRGSRRLLRLHPGERDTPARLKPPTLARADQPRYASAIARKSFATRLAPPTRAPFTLGTLSSSRAFDGLTDPP